MLTTALWTTWLAACGGGPTLDIEVVDVWSSPVEGATVLQEGWTERISVDAQGHASIEVEPGTVRLSAGADGYIKDASVIEVGAEQEGASTTLTLFPIPTSAGFHGIGDKAYVQAQEMPVDVMATEMTTFHGVKDIPKQAVLTRQGQPHRFVFQTTLREQELSRMDIHLSKLKFEEEATVTGPLGETQVKVNLWVSDTDLEYNVKSMDAPDNYLVVAANELEAGVYAFHSQGILDAREADALDKLPKEMRVVYAFEIK